MYTPIYLMVLYTCPKRVKRGVELNMKEEAEPLKLSQWHTDLLVVSDKCILFATEIMCVGAL